MGYLALLIVAAHLGLQWSIIMGVVRARLGIKTDSKFLTLVLRAIAILFAACGIWSLFEVNVGSRLFMQTSFESWDFETATMAFFLHHIAIIGLCAFLAHYSLKLIKALKRRRAHRPSTKTDARVAISSSREPLNDVRA